ncbi:MAG: 30S ribosomal protein S1 [Candidatus Marinimicrobia bacterium]|nr:30S ribosomal protein S1 [Candidatus Neomarinimicrobiota bacterium]MCD6099921.1 30S ribosomal protein S1 [Candidatus Neomarinimicrobiota bacterium]HDN60141.1 30S ribosomal protein S1 [Candidatus Neomarinimicrobiota bacterium]
MVDEIVGNPEGKGSIEQEEEITRGLNPVRTEIIRSGPYVDEIKVVTLDELEKAEERVDEDELKIYESSLKEVSDEQRIIGKVVSVGEDFVVVDVGFKTEGIIPRYEFDESDLPKPGDQIEVFVEVLEDENGQMILSKKKADFMRVWERIREIYEKGEIIEGKIEGRVKGGMVVKVMGIDAFLPGSQIDVRPIVDFDSYVGKTYKFKIVKLNERRKNIVLSRKVLLEEDLKEKREELLSKIKVGQTLTGRVKNITDFGVFVDLGGLDGLLHITDLSWGRVNHPSEVVQLDQEIRVKVIDFDPEKQRVSLGLKQLQPHPWEGIEQKYPVGSVVKGKIVNMTNYGVFVELEKGVEGLIHISEMSWTQHIRHPSELFSLGDEVEAKVLSIDTEERKISLGYKQLTPDPWEGIDEKFKVGGIYKGTVKKIFPNGAFIELDENIEGFLSIDDISWTRKIKHPREVLKRGEEVEVKILDINKENRRISVGMKQVTEDPWPILEGLYVPGAVIEAEISRVGEQVAYVNLQYGIEGIIPLPEAMSDKKAGKKMKVGDKVKLKVEDLNKAEKRIVLSLVREGKKKREKSQIADLLEVREATSKIEIPEEIIEKIKETEKPGEEAESSERKSEKSEKKERETKKVRRTRKKKDEDKTD